VTPLRSTRKTLTVAALGTTQTLASASSYYLPAILAGPIVAGLHVSKSLFFGMFWASLLLQAALGPAIDRCRAAILRPADGPHRARRAGGVGRAQPLRIGGAGILYEYSLKRQRRPEIKLGRVVNDCKTARNASSWGRRRS